MAGRNKREEHPPAGEGAEPAPPLKSLSEARKRMAQAKPAIVGVLMEQSRQGSIPHLKLLIALGVLEKADLVRRKGTKKEKSLEQILNERWAIEDAEAKAAEAEHQAKIEAWREEWKDRTEEG